MKHLECSNRFHVLGEFELWTTVLRCQAGWAKNEPNFTQALRNPQIFIADIFPLVRVSTCPLCAMGVTIPHGRKLLTCRPCSQRFRFSAPTPVRRQLIQAHATPEIVSLCLDGQQAGLIAAVLKPALAVFEFFFIMRIIMSWDPAFNTGKKLPWAVFYKSTEPILSPTRKVIQPIGGVDISPIVWTFILSFLNEILLGPQGILVLIERQGGL